MTPPVDHLIGWVGFRVWKSRVTLGFTIKDCAPMMGGFASPGWSFAPLPVLWIVSEAAGDVAVRVELWGMGIYLRVTL